MSLPLSILSCIRCLLAPEIRLLYQREGCDNPPPKRTTSSTHHERSSFAPNRNSVVLKTSIAPISPSSAIASRSLEQNLQPQTAAPTACHYFAMLLFPVQFFLRHREAPALPTSTPKIPDILSFVAV